MLQTIDNTYLQMVELTEEDLATVTGNGGFDGGFGGCGFIGCGGFSGGFIGGCGFCGFRTGPFISSFTNENANTFAFHTAVATSNFNRTNFFTLFN